MNINKNDYVILNGKKYYAMGGVNVGPDDDNNPQPTETTEKPVYDYKSWFYDKTNNRNGIVYDTDYTHIGPLNSYKKANNQKSSDHSWEKYKNLEDKEINITGNNPIKQKQAFLNSRNEIYNFLKNNASQEDLDTVDLESYKYDTDKRKIQEFDNENSAKINGLFHYYTGVFKANDGIDESKERSKAPIWLGDNVLHDMIGLTYSKNRSLAKKDEQDAIKKAYPKETIVRFMRAEAPEGHKAYTILFANGDRQDIMLDQNNNVYEFTYDGEEKFNNYHNRNVRKGNFSGLVPVGQGHRNHVNNDNIAIGINPNSSGYFVREFNACGGKTSRRLYASGGSMEAPMPLGPQEDYNAINAGGSHEMNPQGGVPYGVNQDGSQNMVEEGEVSVGNNIFSDRTAMSPELCQQLGLPEGTSPAQAMQQIEALYEQGQIGDEEFQEIQQIIFEDQEAQKQNGGEQMPVEGISPEMVQGGGMPPEMMQGSPMPQQVQNEGIQPEMVQGYGFGGYR